MIPFNVHILGCGSALPTLRHNPSSQIVEIRSKFFMIDCGEGTQLALRKSKVSFQKISAVFISHLHGDHCFGLPGLISTFGMMGRTAPLHVYGTPELGDHLNYTLRFFCQGMNYEVVFHPVDTTASEVVYEDRSLTVTTVPLEHRVPCCGYLFREKPTLPHIRRDMIDYYGIPVSQIRNIKRGAGWQTPDGTVIPHEKLVTPPTPPRSYAYCSDTRYIPTLHERIAGVNLLYHESTYSSDMQDHARLYWHSTAKEAAMVARDGNVGQLLLGHYSARYNDETVLLEEAKELFPRTWLSFEKEIFHVM